MSDAPRPAAARIAKHRFFDLAEPATGPTVASDREGGEECGVSVVTPFFEKRAPGVYHNSVVVVGTHGETLGL